MVRKVFSKPPVVGKGSRPKPQSPGSNELSGDIIAFRSTYIFERNMLQQFRTGEKNAYTPSRALDGHTIWDTPEVKPKRNEWAHTYKILSRKCQKVSPVKYVRILFRVLHGSSLPIPTVSQLASINMLTYVEAFLADFVVDMRHQFVAQSQRAKSKIDIHCKGLNQPLGLAVYSVLLDDNVSLSSLYRYCLAKEVSKQLCDSSKDWSSKLASLALEYELEAALEYTIFPKQYAEIWGSTIPEGFKKNANKLLKKAITQLDKNRKD